MGIPARSISRRRGERPLAACRGVLFASPVDDPRGERDARKLSGETGEQRIGKERQRLHALIEELAPQPAAGEPRTADSRQGLSNGQRTTNKFDN
jgi:hypothetical protein